MNKISCPHCEKPGISSVRASFLGPAFPATCRSCGKKVGVPYWSIVTIIPMLVALLVVPRIFTDLHTIAVASVILTGLTFTLFDLVPLIKK